MASCGELQLNLGATRPPSSAIAASICALRPGNSGICSTGMSVEERASYYPQAEPCDLWLCRGCHDKDMLMYIMHIRCSLIQMIACICSLQGIAAMNCASIVTRNKDKAKATSLSTWCELSSSFS